MAACDHAANTGLEKKKKEKKQQQQKLQILNVSLFGPLLEQSPPLFNGAVCCRIGPGDRPPRQHSDHSQIQTAIQKNHHIFFIGFAVPPLLSSPKRILGCRTGASAPANTRRVHVGRCHSEQRRRSDTSDWTHAHVAPGYSNRGQKTRW